MQRRRVVCLNVGRQRRLARRGGQIHISASATASAVPAPATPREGRRRQPDRCHHLVPFHGSSSRYPDSCCLMQRPPPKTRSALYLYTARATSRPTTT